MIEAEDVAEGAEALVIEAEAGGVVAVMEDVGVCKNEAEEVAEEEEAWQAAPGS